MAELEKAGLACGVERCARICEEEAARLRARSETAPLEEQIELLGGAAHLLRAAIEMRTGERVELDNRTEGEMIRLEVVVLRDEKGRPLIVRPGAVKMVRRGIDLVGDNEVTYVHTEGLTIVVQESFREVVEKVFGAGGLAALDEG